MTTAAETVHCEPWCVDGDGHQREHYRRDQWCQGEIIKVVFGLEDLAPALPIATVDLSEPGISVYPRRDWHGLPYVALNVYREHSNEFLAIDTDLRVTAAEARELAAALVDVANVIEEAGG
ncbi:DUF6907 domain-containing protein [Mycolicibacterium austroafricanum]|uniref:DUF6907 domain-containing protein n=1 Tax=Mycolicibacterium austroafricanum TaxID=39687 RepID=UPI000CF853A9|nr:hypothetical protein [Mycolicibacterium austroafricanum]PQP38798.1 hypothetical protein C6A88_34860 [Mycolicibacterium austroafricanum]